LAVTERSGEKTTRGRGRSVATMGPNWERGRRGERLAREGKKSRAQSRKGGAGRQNGEEVAWRNRRGKWGPCPTFGM